VIAGPSPSSRAETQNRPEDFKGKEGKANKVNRAAKQILIAIGLFLCLVFFPLIAVISIPLAWLYPDRHRNAFDYEATRVRHAIKLSARRKRKKLMAGAAL